MTLYQSFVLVMILAVIGACTIIFLALCGVVVLLDKIVKNIRRGIRRRKRLRKEERKVVTMEALESKTYTTEKTLAEQMNERLRELKMTKAEAAMRMNYSRPALSQYLNGKYASDPTEIEKKITEFLLASGGMEGVSETSETTEGTGLKLKSKVEFFESRDFINTIGVCQACQENIGLGIIVGKSGQGKTHALKKYAKLQRVAYIELMIFIIAVNTGIKLMMNISATSSLP